MILKELNALAGGLFLISAFGIVRFRQAYVLLRVFVIQSLLLAFSAFLLAADHDSVHLVALGTITVISKAVLIPLLLEKTVSKEIYTRREISQAINISTSLLLAMLLAIYAYFVAWPLIPFPSGGFTDVNLPIGMAGIFLGAYTLTVRREAVPQLLGILAMENGAFFAGVAIAPNLPMIAELGAAFDALVIVFVMGILIRHIREKTGTTDVSALASLKEGGKPG